MCVDTLHKGDNDDDDDNNNNKVTSEWQILCLLSVPCHDYVNSEETVSKQYGDNAWYR